MTSRLRSALLTGAVAATFALGAAPAQADNPQDPAALPAAEQTAPAPNAGTVGNDFAAEAAPAIEAAPATELQPVTEIAPADPAPVQAEELLADAVIPVLAPETPANDDGGAPAGGVEESTADVDGGAGGMVDPLEEDAVEAPDSAPAEQVAVSGPADLESELAPGTGSDEEPAAGSDQAPGTGSGPAPVAGTPAVPTPAATPAPDPTGFETIVVGGRTLTHADFNIPDEIAASDEETIARWMEDNMDLVLESEGMIYLLDLMMEYLEAGDLDGLADLIREMSVSDPAAGEELILWMYELFAWPGGFEEWPVGEEIFPAPPATEPAPAVSPASVEAAPAALVPAAKQVEQAAAAVAAPAGELAETGASGTIWLASGGAGVLLLGVALVALRRRMA